MFNRELWKLYSMGLTLVFPPVPQIQAAMTRKNLTGVFGDLNEKYEFTNLSFHSGGVTMETEGGGRLHILKDRIQIEERINVYYGETSRQFRDIVSTIMEKINIRMFVLQINRLSSGWDIGEPAIDFMMNRMFRMTPERMKVLIPGMLAGVGMKFSGHDPSKGERHDLVIEPFGGEPARLKFVLDHHFMKPVTGMDDLTGRIDESYGLAGGRVLDFVESFREKDEDREF